MANTGTSSTTNTIETSAVITFIDSNGDISRIYPIAADKVANTTGTGSAYVATVQGITSLFTGVNFVMIPHVVSTSTSPTINVNGLGAIRICRRVTSATATTSGGYNDSWLSANKPVKLTYDGTFWIADMPKPSASDLMGTTPIANGGTGATTAAAALANLYGISKTQVVTTANTDLDNYVATGIYFFASNYTPTNIPGGTNGWLLVMNQRLDDGGSRVKQVWMRSGTAGSNDHQMWVRTCTLVNDTATWGSWRKILTDQDTIAIDRGGTGASNPATALANLYGISKTQSVTTSGKDLDDYVSTGVYFFSSSYTPTNIPGGINGWLIVLNATQEDSSDVYIKQIWLRAGTLNSNDYQMWVRTKYTGGGDWGSWYKILTNVLTDNEYGTSLPDAGIKGRIFFKKVSS